MGQRWYRRRGKAEVSLGGLGVKTPLLHQYLDVAQLGRVPALEAGGRRFKSCRLDQRFWAARRASAWWRETAKAAVGHWGVGSPVAAQNYFYENGPFQPLYNEATRGRLLNRGDISWRKRKRRARHSLRRLLAVVGRARRGSSMGDAKADSGSLLATLLLVLFVGLKLTGYINWSWWWVLSPVWIPIALVVAALGIALLVAAVCGK